MGKTCIHIEVSSFETQAREPLRIHFSQFGRQMTIHSSSDSTHPVPSSQPLQFRRQICHRLADGISPAHHAQLGSQSILIGAQHRSEWLKPLFCHARSRADSLEFDGQVTQPVGDLRTHSQKLARHSVPDGGIPSRKPLKFGRQFGGWHGGCYIDGASFGIALKFQSFKSGAALRHPTCAVAQRWCRQRRGQEQTLLLFFNAVRRCGNLKSAMKLWIVNLEETLLQRNYREESVTPQNLVLRVRSTSLACHT